MTRNITVPAVGESVSSATLAAWLKKDGERVKEGEDLLELETDKANLTVPSPVSGVLRAGAKEGEEVNVGQVVGTVESEETAGAEPPPAGEPASGPAAETPRPVTPEPAAGGKKSSGPVNETLSPSVRRIVEEKGMEPGAIPGTGKNGRITTEDALRAAERRDEGKRPQEARPDGSPGPAASAGTVTTAEPPPMTVRAAEPGERRQRRVPMTNIRRRTAENLVRSKQSSAQLTTFNEIDMSAVTALRAKYREEFEKKHGTRLGFMSFFIRASCRALMEYPEANAFVDGTDILYNDYFDVGVALSTDRGLITPVIRNADRKSFAAVEAEIVSFAERAKLKKLTPDELSGATFTITNGGVFGSLLSTPIPSPPQTAILGMHAIQRRPVAAEDDRIEVRPMMYVALTYDHRIIDGREAIGFLMTVKRSIEDPERLLLEL